MTTRWLLDDGAATENDRIWDLVALVADADHTEIALRVARNDLAPSASLVSAPIARPMRKKIARVRPSGFLITTVAVASSCTRDAELALTHGLVGRECAR